MFLRTACLIIYMFRGSVCNAHALCKFTHSGDIEVGQDSRSACPRLALSLIQNDTWKLSRKIMAHCWFAPLPSAQHSIVRVYSSH